MLSNILNRGLANVVLFNWKLSRFSGGVYLNERDPQQTSEGTDHSNSILLTPEMIFRCESRTFDLRNPGISRVVDGVCANRRYLGLEMGSCPRGPEDASQHSDSYMFLSRRSTTKTLFATGIVVGGRSQI